jgi:hypothetical protein
MICTETLRVRYDDEHDFVVEALMLYVFNLRFCLAINSFIEVRP